MNRLKAAANLLGPGCGKKLATNVDYWKIQPQDRFGSLKKFDPT
jgi:hypothetical protein